MSGCNNCNRKPTSAAGPSRISNKAMHQQQPSINQRSLIKTPSQPNKSCIHSHHHDKNCKMAVHQHQHSPPQCSYTWQGSNSNQAYYPGKVPQCPCFVQNEYHQAVQDYLPCHPNSAFVSVNPSHQKRVHLMNESPSNTSSYKNQCQTHFVSPQQSCASQAYHHQFSHNPLLHHYHVGPHQHFNKQLHFHVHNSPPQLSDQTQNQKHGTSCTCHSKGSHLFHQQMSLQAATHYQQYHYRLLQKRPMDEGDKLKRSRDGWDYELSQDLQAKQIEMLKRKYGGEARTGRAARIIQQAYRRYSLDKNFAKLKLEVDKRRLSRRFNEAGRSKTIWMDACSATSAYPEYLSSANQSRMPIGHGNTNFAKERIQWFPPEYYPTPQNFHGMAITTTTISEERSIRKEEKTVVMPIMESGVRNFEEFNTVKKSDARIVPPQNHMHLSEHSGVSKALSFCTPITGYDHSSSNESYMLHQDMIGIDNAAEYDNELVAELPPVEDTLDDEIFEHTFAQSEAVPEESSRTNESIFRSLSSHEQVQNSCQQLSNDSEEASSHINLRPCNSLRRGEVITGNESKCFSSPVWKRKMVHADSTTDDYSTVHPKDMEPPVIPQTSFVTHAPPHAKPDVTHFGQHSNFPNKPRVSDKQRKRTYRIGLNLFNKKPEKGICYLIERHFLDNRPSAVARFLIARKGLSKQMIGEYLGNLQKQFNMEVLRCFAEEIDLTALEIDVALRKFQSFFRMPGEAQKIERLMEAFASHYCQCNPEVVKSFNRPDTVFLLAFATIMLNTDLHNKSIKHDRKMKLEDFIKNLRGIDEGEDVNHVLLAGIYERIKALEFVPGSDHVSQVAKVEQMIVGKKPQLAELHRRLVCYCRLYEVQDPNRKEKIGLHQREVFLFNDMIMVTKIIGKKRNSVTYSFRCTFSLSGMIVYLFESQYYKHGIRLTNGSNGKATIMLNARNEHDRSKFVEDLKEAILEMNEMESLRIEEELMKQQMMKQKHCNYNRHSKDSGVVDIELLRPSDFGSNRLSTAVDGSARVSSSPSLPDVIEYVHRGSAGSLDSGLVSIHT